MPQIKAQDELAINASVPDVWRVLTDIPNYPEWWPKLVNLKILAYNPEIIGTEFQANPLGGKSFSCRVKSIIPNEKIQLEYFNGIYKGEGIWKLERDQNSIIVSYSVDLEIVDKSIALLSRVIPIPKLHSIIFTKILNGLAERLKSNSLTKST